MNIVRSFVIGFGVLLIAVLGVVAAPPGATAQDASSLCDYATAITGGCGVDTAPCDYATSIAYRCAKDTAPCNYATAIAYRCAINNSPCNYATAISYRCAVLERATLQDPLVVADSSLDGIRWAAGTIQSDTGTSPVQTSAPTAPVATADAQPVAASAPRAAQQRTGLALTGSSTTGLIMVAYAIVGLGSAMLGTTRLKRRQHTD